MGHAQRCPVCLGRGWIEENSGTTSGIVRKVCHGCGGLGWIQVSDNFWYPIYPYYHPYTMTWTWTYTPTKYTKGN